MIDQELSVRYLLDMQVGMLHRKLDFRNPRFRGEERVGCCHGGLRHPPRRQFMMGGLMHFTLQLLSTNTLLQFCPI